MSALIIKNLAKTYANGFTALKGINLKVDVGGFYSLLGPNGAGKTTAIRIVCSLVEKSSGNIEVFGYNLATHPELVKMHIDRKSVV
jgi:ABC-2 type transport system ATP-binding protein